MDKNKFKETLKEMILDGDIEFTIGLKKEYYTNSIELKVLIDKEEVCSSEFLFDRNDIDED